MAKFNVKTKGTKVENLAGGEAHKESVELEVLSILFTSFVKDSYYESESDALNRFRELIASMNEEQLLFLAKAAIYARNEFGMRSITHIAAGEIAKIVKGKEWTKKFFDKVIHRVDDITEILAYYISNYKKPIPNSLKKGLACGFSKFNEYQLAKYKSGKKEVSLIDAVNLIRPKPCDKNKEALAKLVKGELKSFDTWESELSEAGLSENKEEAKKEVWEKLIKEKKIGYFALLRNLRNILEQSPDVIDEACELLVDEKMIKNSLVMPFRFSTALNEIKNLDGNNKSIRKVITAISKAMDISLNNVPDFDGDNLVVCDFSGSMGSGYTDNKGKGSLFGVALAKKNNADFMIFGSRAAYYNVNPSDSILTNLDKVLQLNEGHRGLEKWEVDHGTDFHEIFNTANKKYDRIIIFSDMQGWQGGYSTPSREFNMYKARCKADPKIFSFDLAGYGTLQFPEKNIFCLAGFSDKTMDLLKLLDNDKKALIEKIRNVEI